MKIPSKIAGRSLIINSILKETAKSANLRAIIRHNLETIEKEIAFEAETRALARVQNPQTVEKPKSNKLTFKEKRELETLETKIPETENRLAEIETELTKFATDSFKLNELVTEQKTLNEQLEKSVERWAELAEKADL